MRVGIIKTSATRRINAHRALSLTLSFLALAGWGTFAYSAGSSEDTQRQLRQEVAQLTASQDQLLAERQQLQDTVGEAAELRAKLASAHAELRTLAEKREQAKVQVAAAQQELSSVTRALTEKRAKVSEASRVRVAERSSKPAPGRGQVKGKT